MTRKQLVGGGRFGYAAHVVVKRYQTGRVVLNRDLHHFPGMNTGAIDRAVEELFNSDEPISDIDQHETLTVFPQHGMSIETLLGHSVRCTRSALQTPH